MNRTKRVCFLTVLTILLLLIVQSYPQINDTWPYIGELTEYTLSYFGVPASKICFHVVDTLRLNNRLIFQVNVAAKSIGFWSKLFKLDNIYESYIDYHHLLPLKFSKKVRQKNIKQNWMISFDQANHIAQIDSEKVWPIPENCHNFFSMIYTIRQLNFADIDSFELYLDVESIVWKTVIRKIAREIICLPSGNYKAIRFSLDFIPVEKGKKRSWKTDLLTNRMANENSELSIWFSDDAFRMMLMIEYKHSIFSTKVQLSKIYRSISLKKYDGDI